MSTRHTRTGRKRIEAVVEKGANYVFHLMAVAGVWFENDYGREYRRTVPASDIDFLKTHSSLLRFGDGHMGPLSYPAIFLPAYLNLGSEQALREYFSLLERGVAGEPEPFLERYQEPFQRLKDWNQRIDEEWLAAGADLLDVTRDLGALYLRNFPAYETRVWPEERPEMEEVASRLNRHFASRDVIGAWERFTGLEFKGDSYEIILVSALKNGPNANSLSYDRNVFYSGSDFEWMTQFISHETGTHILTLTDMIFFSPDEGGMVHPDGPGGPAYSFDLVYRAYENLCRFYNTLVLGTRDIYTMGDDYWGDEFDTVYREIHAADPGLTPREMLLEGIARFVKSRGGQTAGA